MKNVRCLRISGKARVKGIVNTNGGGLSKENHKNHIHAKKDLMGRDFTSGQCLEFNLYGYMQPTPENLREVLPKFAASIPGLIRGYLEPKNGMKRMKSFRTLDSYTDESQLIESKNADGVRWKHSILKEEQCSSSKDREGKSVGDDGDEKSDTSLYSIDSAPERHQIIDAELNFADLQFLRLTGQGAMVAAGEKESFLESLKQTFALLQVHDPVSVGNYENLHDPFSKKVEGILLSDIQMKALAEWYLKKLKKLSISKRKGWWRTDRTTLEVSVVFSGEEDDFKCKLDELDLSKVEFAKDWKLVS